MRDTGEGWQARPTAAMAVRGVAIAVPLILGVAAGVVVTRALPRPEGWRELLVVWVMGFLTSSLVILATNRLARRVLPLAALLELSLSFPDHTPSRVGVALRAGNLSKASARRHALRAAEGPDRAAAVEAVLALAAALSDHDRATRGHSERVRAYAELLCEELHLPAEDRVRLRWASLLHDVGKMAVPADLLNKNGAPDDEEWEVLKRHPAEGARLTAALAPFLGEYAHAIEQHHERWDGTGYPHGLAGTDIQQGARVVAVADAYEVMTSARAYKAPLPTAEARRRLAAGAGSQFDPVVVRAFLNVSLGRLRVAAGPLAWLGQVPFLRPLTAGAGAPASVALGGALAAAVGMATLAPASSPHLPVVRAEVASGQELPRAAELPPVVVVVTPAAEAAAVPEIPTPPAPPSPPPLATAETNAPAADPTPPPAEEPAPLVPVPEPPRSPTPLVAATVQVDQPVPLGLAVGVGDAEGAPVAPVAVNVHLP